MSPSILKFLVLLLLISPRIIFAEQQEIKPLDDKGEGMDKQTRLFLEQMNAIQAPPMETMPIEEVRRYVEQFAETSSIQLASISNIKIPSSQTEIPLRIYVPKGKGPFPVFVTIHGGGWVFGSLNVHDSFCRNINWKLHMFLLSSRPTRRFMCLSVRINNSILAKRQFQISLNF